MVGFVIRHDTSGKIMFSALQSETGKSLLQKYGHSEDYLKAVVYLRENKYYSRSSAVLNILRDMGGGWSLLYGFIIIPQFIRDLIYNIIAALRLRISGKRVACRAR
jgi:predicted DCC family thiol-disulfide oxidoreductase YuxK